MRKPDPITLAKWLHQRYNLKLPVNPTKLARDLCIDVIYERLSPNISGGLVAEVVGNDTHYIILLNIRHSRTRQVFTCAHELGHFHLHRGVKPAFAYSLAGKGDVLESEANRFAAELLMPEAWVRKASNLMSLREMASHLGVSQSALQRRFRELRISIRRGSPGERAL